MKLTVCGAGNSGKAIAGDAALAGYDVTLYSRPEFHHTVDPIIETKMINITGPQNNYKKIKREGVAHLKLVTMDAAKAIKGADMICVSVQAIGFEKLFREIVPHLEDGQIVLIMPDNYGSCILRRVMREMNCTRKIIVAGANSMPYAARVSNNSSVNQVCMLYRQTAQTIDTYPSSDWDEFWKVLKDFEPYKAADIKHGDTMLGVNFDNLNPILHVPAVLLNSGTIDNWGHIEDVGSNAVYYNIYRHGLSHSVASMQYAFYQEELKLAKAMDFAMDEEEKDLFFSRFSLVGPLIMGEGYKIPITENLPDWHRMEYLPGDRFTVDNRYISEDVPVGCKMFYELARLSGTRLPVIESLINFAGIIVGRDYFKEGFDLDYVGLGGMTKDELLSHLRTGSCPGK